MLAPGPRTMPMPWSLASSPIAFPTAMVTSVFQVEANVTAAGKQVAGRELFIPSMSLSAACFLSPNGPSHM